MNNNELNKIVDGNEMNDILILCPLCNQYVDRKESSAGETKEGCIATYYYKCPNCKGSFHS